MFPKENSTEREWFKKEKAAKDAKVVKTSRFSYFLLFQKMPERSD